MNATKIESFIFVDLETSGFNANNQLAELALISVHRNAMEEAEDSIGETLPRVLDKLVLCVDPGEEVSYNQSSKNADRIFRT